MNQAFNPFLPSYEYIPDAEPYVFDDRVYIFGSHDQFGGKYYCQNDYVCWSADINDLANWRYEGEIYNRTEDPLFSEEHGYMNAPDVARGSDGKFYLYYQLTRTTFISVAVCDTPTGTYKFLGHVS